MILFALFIKLNYNIIILLVSINILEEKNISISFLLLAKTSQYYNLQSVFITLLYICQFKNIFNLYIHYFNYIDNKTFKIFYLF